MSDLVPHAPPAPAGSPPSYQYEFEEFCLDPVKRFLLKSGKRVTLTGKSVDTLLALVERAGETLTKGELMQAVWGSSTVEENNLNQCISAIRKALGEQRGDHNFILTVSGVGYRFVAAVHRAEIQAPISEPVGSEIVRARPYAATVRVALVLAALIVFAAGIYAMRHRAASVVAAQRHTTVILPLEILPAAPQNNWLSTALGEMLYHELAAPGSMRIISLDETARMERELPRRVSASESLRDIRSYTQADFALGGTVIILSDHANKPLRIDLHVQDLRNGEVVASAIAEGSEQDLFILVHALSDRMRQALGIAQSPAAAARSAIPSRRPAMQLYADGLAALRSSDFLTAKDRFLQAVEADSSNALCYAALSSAWHGLGYDQEASGAARHAFDLTSSLDQLDRLAIEGRYRLATHDWPRAAAIYEVILKLIPDSLEDALSLLEAYRYDGKNQEGQRIVAALHNLPAPIRDDPRIDVEEARMVGATWSNYSRVAQLAGIAARKAKQRHMLGLYARARTLQGGALLNMGDSNGAAAARREAATVCEELHDSMCLAQLLRVEGNQALLAGKLRQAENRFSQALKLARQIGNRGEQLQEFNGLAVMHFWMRDFQAADADFRDALASGEDLKAGNIETLINYSSLLLATGRLPEAVQAVNRALTGARAHRQVESEANALALRAETEMLMGRPRDALVSATEASRVAQRSSSQMTEFFASLEMARSRVLAGDTTGAHDSIRTAEGYRGLDVFSKLDLFLAQAQVAFNEGDYAQAERFARDEVEQARVCENREFEMRGENLLAAALLAQDRTGEAQGIATRLNGSSHPDVHGLGALDARLAALQVEVNLQPSSPWAGQFTGLAEEARKIGYVESALEIQLAGARWSARKGDLRPVRQVESEAALLGYKSVAARAHRIYAAEYANTKPSNIPVKPVASRN